MEAWTPATQEFCFNKMPDVLEGQNSEGLDLWTRVYTTSCAGYMHDSRHYFKTLYLM